MTNEPSTLAQDPVDVSAAEHHVVEPRVEVVTTVGPEAVSGQVTLTPFRRYARRLRKDIPAMVALAYIVILVLTAIFAPFVAPHDPSAQGIAPPFSGPGPGHLLGTDDLGRDTLSRLIFAARVSLGVGGMVIAIALLVAVPIGLIAGYHGGRTDNVIMRVMDAIASLPALILALAVVGILGPSLTNAAFAIAVAMVPGFVRMVRAQSLDVRQETFIEASQSLGTPIYRILFKRVLPNVASPLIVATTIGLGAALLAEAGLSMLGFGVQPPSASWGAMLQQGRSVMFTDPWLVYIPGAVLAVTILAFNTFGDGVRDAVGMTRATGKAAVKGKLGISTSIAPRSTSPARPATEQAMLEVRNLSVEFVTEHGQATVVNDINLSVAKGEILGLVGESGSGKSVTSLALMRLLPSPPGRITSGEIVFDGRDVLQMSRRELRSVRGNDIAMVFQDPMTSLNPAFTIGDQLIEAVLLHRKIKKAAARARAVELLELVGIPDPQKRLAQFPHEFSGGMRQRALIAIALANEPKLLIADEPTTALDVTVQAQIIDLLRRLQKDIGMGVIFVTHDLGVVAEICDRVAVMYAGQIVETAPVAELFSHPKHPYTAGLLASMPQTADQKERLVSIPGLVPLPGSVTEGCRFRARCSYAADACAVGEIILSPQDVNHEARCVRSDELNLESVR
ncbi:hypothetical protein ASG88_17600 [Nocardioides sp. Soil777]|uniref:dipeptide/oligopeptide/nickel ABC transporter permease/ATP-binding protein n=1 Tax=Nocardioides sp. Soil777 TaxID=1736409 RepID=UPI0007032304|nr:dipeptide/oligopeptide/nickel ABC transporter permease/ATP-binding protein [Nocardioides sp. Soil777]KRE97996.1 hypothetical protein ASG88_17600 [Nocardioides sp. Soil777]